MAIQWAYGCPSESLCPISVFGVPLQYFLLWFIAPLVMSGILWYVLYRLYISGKMTIRPVFQGIISLLIALVLFFVFTHVFQPAF